MVEKYGEKGLVIVGVTNESKQKVDKALGSWGMDYPVAIVDGKDIDRSYGVRGFPSSVLIDSAGKVVWSGHPATFKERVLVDLLPKGSVAPVLPARYEQITFLVRSENFGKAWAAITASLKRSPADRDLIAMKGHIEGLAKERFAAVVEAEEEGDYTRVLELLGNLQQSFLNTPMGARALKMSKELRDLPRVQNELYAAKLVAKALNSIDNGNLDKARDILALLEDERFDQTRSGKKGREIHDDL